MTNLEKVKKLFNELDIEFNIEDREDEIVVCLRSKTKNVGGYKNFCTEFNFNKDESFNSVGLWEE